MTTTDLLQLYNKQRKLSFAVPVTSIPLSALFRVMGVVVLHVLTWISKWFALYIIANHWNKGFAGAAVFLAVVMFICGCFCVVTAWHSLKKYGFCGCIWAIPVGFLQLIVPLIAVDEHRSMSFREPSLGAAGNQGRFHCRFIIGVFEGVTMFTVLLFFLWRVIDPDGPNALFPDATDSLQHHEELGLFASAALCLVSAGVSLAEMDFYTSRRVAERMQGSMWYEFVHFLFRASEIFVRVAIFCIFVILLRAHPLAAKLSLLGDLLAALALILCFSGTESGALARVAIALVCSVSNVFLFLDSPSKQRVARKLARRMQLRNLLEPLAFLLVVMFVYGQRESDLPAAIVKLARAHSGSLSLAAAALIVYLFTLCYVSRIQDEKPDIFSAAERGDLQTVQDMLRSKVVISNPDACDVNGKTALMLATAAGHEDVVKELLRAGALVKLQAEKAKGSRWHQGWTALHFAVHAGSFSLARLLLSQA
jgi:hypothetical protein